MSFMAFPSSLMYVKQMPLPALVRPALVAFDGGPHGQRSFRTPPHEGGELVGMCFALPWVSM
jgi:hypothetical protein